MKILTTIALFFCSLQPLLALELDKEAIQIQKENRRRDQPLKI